MGLDGKNGNFHWFSVFTLIRCGYHPRTSQPTLDHRELHASATAVLRTPPCLFKYAGTPADITGKYTAAVKQLSASFARISPLPLSS